MLPLKHIHHKKIKKLPGKYSPSLFDQFIYIVALAGPVMTIPQIGDIWTTKQTSINITTWISYLIISIIWMIYGIKHKETVITFSNFLGTVTNSLVVLGVMLYR